MLTRNHSLPPTHRSKMVNVQDDHPFMLVPPLRPSPSPSPPSGSQPWTPDGDYPEHSPGRVNEDSHSEPILDVKLIKAPRSKSRKMNGLGRGRDRTRANGSPLVVNGDGKLPDVSVKASVRCALAYLCLSASFVGTQENDEPLKVAPLMRPDDDLVSLTTLSRETFHVRGLLLTLPSVLQLSRLPDDVRKSLLDGFHLRDSGRVVQTWDDT